MERSFSWWPSIRNKLSLERSASCIQSPRLVDCWIAESESAAQRETEKKKKRLVATMDPLDASLPEDAVGSAHT